MNKVQTEDLLPEASRLITLLPDLLKGLYRLRHLHSKDHECDLTFNQLSILFQLRQNQSLTMGELSKNLDIELSNATQMVDRLHKMEYIKRAPDTRDRRVVRISLTQKGRDTTGHYYEIHLSALIKTLQQIDPQKRVMLFHCLESLQNILSELSN
jgi:DNA-binding MarR family transcriptional regulator